MRITDCLSGNLEDVGQCGGSVLVHNAAPAFQSTEDFARQAGALGKLYLGEAGDDPQVGEGAFRIRDGEELLDRGSERPRDEAKGVDHW